MDPFGNEEVKLSLIANSMMLYVENPKEFHKKATRADKFNVSGYRLTQKSVEFLYTCSEQSERKLRKYFDLL